MKNKKLVIVLLVMTATAIVFLSRPLWCNHVFLTTNETEATCEKAGAQYRKCRKCGLERELEIPALGHDLSVGNLEYSLVGDTVFETETKICNRCDYTELVAPKNCGNYKEYAVKICLSFWLVEHKMAVFNMDNVTIEYIEDGDYYHVFGMYTSILSPHSSGLVLADIEIGDTDEGGALRQEFSGKQIYTHVFQVTTNAGIETDNRIFNPM